MGQSATLYRIDIKNILKLIEDTDSFDLAVSNKEYVTFEKSFEGLRFLLSKDKSGEEDELIHQIFYPESHAGEAIDFEEIDIDDIPENFDWSSNAVYYNEPAVVKAISDFLNTISEQQFAALFDADELNQNDVYPGSVWNNNTDPAIVFNPRHMIQEFARLKAFYSAASHAGDNVIAIIA
jgi:hypothetical protein